MAVTRQKSVERLLATCEGLVSDSTHFQGKEWKLSQYVVALRRQVTELERYSSVDQDMMAMFQHKVAVLEEIVHSQSSPSPPNLVTKSEEGQVKDAPVKKSLVQKEREARAELFGQSTSEGSLRHRSSAMRSEGSEVAMERHRRNQEAIADEMMGLARSLKKNAIAARSIIRNDNKVLKETSEKAEDNTAAVDAQTGRIKEHNKGCPWGTILLLAVVFVIFLAMVILIRIVPKPR